MYGIHSLHVSQHEAHTESDKSSESSVIIHEECATPTISMVTYALTGRLAQQSPHDLITPPDSVQSSFVEGVVADALSAAMTDSVTRRADVTRDTYVVTAPTPVFDVTLNIHVRAASDAATHTRSVIVDNQRHRGDIYTDISEASTSIDTASEQTSRMSLAQQAPARNIHSIGEVLSSVDEQRLSSHIKTEQYFEETDTLSPSESVEIYGRVMTKESSLERLPSVEMVSEQFGDGKTRKGKEECILILTQQVTHFEPSRVQCCARMTHLKRCSSHLVRVSHNILLQCFRINMLMRHSRK